MAASPPLPPASSRLRSLDLFRGATIASMILVNNQASDEHSFSQLLHAKWHGWTFTDTVFPFFLWIVGVAITLSTAKRIERGENRFHLLRHAAQRAFIIFALGFFLGPLPNFHWETVRIPGVLQRIAVCYLAATVIFLSTGLRGQLIAFTALNASYWGFMAWYPVPGHGAGVLEPIGNFAQFIDQMLLSGHMWRHSQVWDPEGVWSTLPAIGTVLLGVFAGHLLRSKRSPERKTALFAGWGVTLFLLGQACSFALPVNKSLWTVSFSLLMGGLAFLAFGCWYWIADVSRLKLAWLKPLEWMGMNAILLYLLSGALTKLFARIQVGDKDLGQWLYADVYSSFTNAANASALHGMTHVLLLGLMAWFLHWRRWYLKV